MSGLADLAVIVPDLDIEKTIEALLDKRQQSLGIAPIRFKIFRRHDRDAGVRARGAEFSRGFMRQYRHCLLVFDHEGSGAESSSPDRLEAEIRQQLSRVGWGNEADVVVISPELEIWLWGTEPHLSQVIGWSGGPALNWLVQQNFALGQHGKPTRPKEALESVLRRAGRPHSASIYSQVASRCSLRNCHDSAFNRFQRRLQDWFPASPP